MVTARRKSTMPSTRPILALVLRELRVPNEGFPRFGLEAVGGFVGFVGFDEGNEGDEVYRANVE
jgi:hypothetical protein